MGLDGGSTSKSSFVRPDKRTISVICVGRTRPQLRVQVRHFDRGVAGFAVWTEKDPCEEPDPVRGNRHSDVGQSDREWKEIRA